MKSIVAILFASLALVACSKKEEAPAATTSTPVVDSQGQPVKTESGSAVVTEGPAAAASAASEVKN